MVADSVDYINQSSRQSSIYSGWVARGQSMSGQEVNNFLGRKGRKCSLGFSVFLDVPHILGKGEWRAVLKRGLSAYPQNYLLALQDYEKLEMSPNPSQRELFYIIEAKIRFPSICFQKGEGQICPQTLGKIGISSFGALFSPSPLSSVPRPTTCAGEPLVLSMLPCGNWSVGK